jgi:hypothetical protein
MPHLHTLGEYRDAIEQFAIYPEAGTGSHRAQRHVTLGLFSELIGAVAADYQKAERDDAGDFTTDRLIDLKRQMGDALWYITRGIVEFETHNDGLIWGKTLHELQMSVHVERSIIEAFMSVPRVVVQTDFRVYQDVLTLLHLLGISAARHGWSIQDLAFANVAKLKDRAARGVLQGAGEYR